jgi:hypothetical protein
MLGKPKTHKYKSTKSSNSGKKMLKRAKLKRPELDSSEEGIVANEKSVSETHRKVKHTKEKYENRAKKIK